MTFCESWYNLDYSIHIITRDSKRSISTAPLLNMLLRSNASLHANSTKFNILKKTTITIFDWLSDRI